MSVNSKGGGSLQNNKVQDESAESLRKQLQNAMMQNASLKRENEQLKKINKAITTTMAETEFNLIMAKNDVPVSTEYKRINEVDVKVHSIMHEVSGKINVDLCIECKSEDSRTIAIIVHRKPNDYERGQSYASGVIVPMFEEILRIDQGSISTGKKHVIYDFKVMSHCYNQGGQHKKFSITIKVVNLPKETVYDYGNYDEEVIVLVEGQKIPVKKTYLSIWSPMFGALFSSDMKERRDGLYPIQGWSASEFKELLLVIYPLRKPITQFNVEHLLGMADQFLMSTLKRMCEAFLADSCEHSFTNAEVLKFADRYNLELLRTVVLERLPTTESVRKEIIKMKEFGEYSATTKRAIDARYVKLDVKEKSYKRDDFYDSDY